MPRRKGQVRQDKMKYLPKANSIPENKEETDIQTNELKETSVENKVVVVQEEI